MSAWTLADSIVFFTNDRSRALRDMVGDTDVFKKIYHAKIKAYMAGQLPNESGETAYAQ